MMGPSSISTVHTPVLRKKNTAIQAAFLMVICTLFSAAGQILQKYGALQIDFQSPLSIVNMPLFLGLASYAAGAGVMLIALKKGELSLLFPILATSYVWVSVFSPLLFPEDSMNGWKWLGVFIILISVSILGLSASKVESPMERGDAL